jgi:hypothetical protein
MPGQSKCFRCGSVLDGKDTVVDVHPPRMAPWKRPLRDMARWARRCKILPSGAPAKSRSSRIKTHAADYNCLWGLLLSIVPGLAHLVDHRFREIRWYVLGWLIALGIGLFLYGTNIGLCFVGLAVGLHAWIAVQHSLMKRLETLGERLGAVLVVLIMLALFYRFLPRLLLPDLTGGYTALTLPYQNIQQRDYLLGWRDEASDHPRPRGSLILTRMAYIGRRRMAREGTMFVQIIGLPDETIQINGETYVIDGKPLDREKYPPPRWLHERRISIIVPPGSYFVDSEYNAARNIREGHIRTACLVRFEDIRARAFMRWLPLSRRGFIEETE